MHKLLVTGNLDSYFSSFPSVSFPGKNLFLSRRRWSLFSSFHSLPSYPSATIIIISLCKICCMSTWKERNVYGQSLHGMHSMNSDKKREPVKNHDKEEEELGTKEEEGKNSMRKRGRDAYNVLLYIWTFSCPCSLIPQQKDRIKRERISGHISLKGLVRVLNEFSLFLKVLPLLFHPHSLRQQCTLILYFVIETGLYVYCNMCIHRSTYIDHNWAGIELKGEEEEGRNERSSKKRTRETRRSVCQVKRNESVPHESPLLLPLLFNRRGYTTKYRIRTSLDVEWQNIIYRCKIFAKYLLQKDFFVSRCFWWRTPLLFFYCENTSSSSWMHPFNNICKTDRVVFASSQDLCWSNRNCLNENAFVFLHRIGFSFQTLFSLQEKQQEKEIRSEKTLFSGFLLRPKACDIQ